MKVKYQGAHVAVDVPLPTGGEVTVEHGAILETTSEHAKQLLDQPDNWAPVKGASAKEEVTTGGDR